MFAASFQEAGIRLLLSQWLARASRMAVSAGESNVHSVLSALGLAHWLVPASLLLVTGFGLWVYRQRRCDIWIVLGVDVN